jgi:flagellar protein FliT
MNPQQTILAHYESIARFSSLMVRAARSSDWQGLVDAEECCALLIERLKSAGDPTIVLDEGGRKRKHEIIRRVLADDAEVRECTQPWLRKLNEHLGYERTARSVEAAYRP